MKKQSLFLTMLLAFAVSAMAQSTLPRPADPTIDEWIDYTGGWYTADDGTPFFISGFSYMGMTIAQTIMTQEPVADDYTIDKEFEGGEFTILDKDKVTYSVFTDFDELFVFTPENYPRDFTEPTTEIPFGYEGFEFGWWEIHFPNLSNTTEGQEHFFEWRIGLRTNYRDSDQMTCSNIVYWEIGPKPVSMLGDVNNDGNVNISDVTALINYLLSGDVSKINKFNADVNDTNNVNISDVTALINLLLSQN